MPGTVPGAEDTATDIHINSALMEHTFYWGQARP